MDFQRNNEPLAYSVKGACSALSIGRTLLYELIAKGKIETRKVGGRTLIPAASIHRFLSEPEGGGQSTDKASAYDISALT